MRLRACVLVFVLTLSSVFTQAQAPDDVRQALDAVRAAAEAGDVVAQYSLGSLLYYGDRDTAQAIAWIRRAAEQGYGPAEFHLGQVHEYGFGVASDEAEALAWYRKAAAHGYVPAHRALGDFHLKGRAVKADPTEAARHYQRAADGDDLRAQVALGQLYFDGTGIGRDYVSAWVWFSLAAAQTPLEDNRKGILELRDIAAVRMSDEQRADAERRLKAWRPVH